MKDGKFETRAEIWRHLINGGKVAIEGKGKYLYLKGDELYDSEGYKYITAFNWPDKWSIYEPPKPKKKITLYNYIYEDGGNLWESGFTSREFSKISFLSEVKLIKTESKEVEYDDV